MSELKKSALDLWKLYDNFTKKIGGFDESFNDLDNLLIKVGNYQSSQKVVFIGRGGSTKSDLVSGLINFSIPGANFINSKFMEYNLCNKDNSYELRNLSNSQYSSIHKFKIFLDQNYSKWDSCLKINLPKSENSVLNKVTIFDTPCYNYSDELDNEIVEKCKDANIFVLVLSAVGSIGDRDKRFLARISDKTFVNKLIFIFTNMENVPESDLISVKRQHKSNAYRIANEILLVPHTDIPIFFVKDNINSNKDNIKNFLQHLENYNLTSCDENVIIEKMLAILVKLEKLIKDEQILICKEKVTLNKNSSENKRINKDETLENDEILNEILNKILDEITNENIELYSKLKLIDKWRNNIEKLKKFRVDKKEDFQIFSKFESKKTKIVIEKKLDDINVIKESENNKIPKHILSKIDEYASLIFQLKNFSEKFNVDQFRFLSNRYDELIDFVNKTDGEMFDRISILLVDIELELLLILIYIKKHKNILKMKHKVETRIKRKGVLRNILEKMTTTNNILSERKSDIDSNKVISESINSQNSVVDNSNEILEDMLEKLAKMIEFDRNKIFVKLKK